MKLNFSADYKVIKEKIVKCTLVCVLSDCDELLTLQELNGREIDFMEDYDGSERRLFEVTALAKCSPKDEFNLELGKRIAESRASIKALKLVKSLSKLSREAYSEMVTLSDDSYNKADRILTREENHLKALLGNE